MAERFSHFEIPPSLVRSTTIKVRGRAKRFERPDYSAHGDFLRERTAAAEAAVAATADNEAAESLFLQLRTPESLPIRGERERLKSAGFDVVELSSVDPNSGTVRLKKTDIRGFHQKLDRYATSEKHRGKSYLSIIEDLSPVPPENKISPELVQAPDEPTDCLLLFYSSLSEKERAAVLFAVRSFLSRAGSVLGEMRRYSNGVTAVEARLRPSEARLAGAAFSTLRQVVPNHVFFVPDQWRISPFSPDVEVRGPQIATSVAVIDTGISPACLGLAGCVSHVLPYLPPGSVSPEYSHGTFVGSRIAYGDDLEHQLRRGLLTPLCPLVDIPVFGVDEKKHLVRIHEGHLATVVDDVLPRLPSNARVLNISLGNMQAAVDGVVSIVAQLLDKHVRELNLVAVTTAGNIRERALVAGYPHSLAHDECRIDSPGDSLLALTVGSIARYTDTDALSPAGRLSPFSRRGPGPLGGMKPDLVAHGGNCFPDLTTTARIGVHGLASERNAWACDYGTSFAAPLVSAMCARLMDHYQNPHANLVRALLLHFATPVVPPPISIAPHNLVGLGEPDLDLAMWSRDHAATFLHAGILAPSTFTYLPFFVPPSLASGGPSRLRIRATLTIDPPVSPDNLLEYSKARVTLGLRKPKEVGHADIGVSDVSLEVDKWSPVAQVDKIFHSFYETGSWELRVRLWTRDLEADFRQPFAVVIEVIDDNGLAPVRAETDAAVGTVFNHVPVRVAA